MTNKKSLAKLLAHWRAEHPECARWSDGKVHEAILLRLSALHPERFSYVETPRGKVWTIKSHPFCHDDPR